MNLSYEDKTKLLANKSMHHKNTIFFYVFSVSACAFLIALCFGYYGKVKYLLYLSELGMVFGLLLSGKQKKRYLNIAILIAPVLFLVPVWIHRGYPNTLNINLLAKGILNGFVSLLFLWFVHEATRERFEIPDHVIKIIKAVYVALIVLNIIIVFIQLFFGVSFFWQNFYGKNEMNFRPCGLFQEPSHIAIFSIPILFINTLGKFIKWLMVVCLFIVQSALGYIVIFVFLLKIMVVAFNRGDWFKSVVVPLVGISIFFGIYWNDKSRVDNIINLSDVSFTYRLVRSFMIYKELPFTEKIIGIGPLQLAQYGGNTPNVLVNSSILKYGDKYADISNYISGFFGNIIYWGLFAALIFIIYLSKIFLNSYGKCFLLLFFILTVFAELLIGNQFMFFLILMSMVGIDPFGKMKRSLVVPRKSR